MGNRGQYRSYAITLFDGKDFRALPSDARWIFVLLKANLGYAGIDVRYRDELPHRLVGQSGLTLARVLDAIDALEAVPWIQWDDNILWIHGQLEHDPHLQPGDGKHRKGLLRHLSGLPRLPIVGQFVKAHPEWCKESELKRMDLGWALEAPSKPLGSPIEAREGEGKGIGEGKGVGKKMAAAAKPDVPLVVRVLESFPKLHAEVQEPDAPMLETLALRFHATTTGALAKLVGEIAGALDGMHGERRSWPELRTNIGDFLINPDAQPNMRVLRGYLYKDPQTAATRNGKATTGERAFSALDAAVPG